MNSPESCTKCETPLPEGAAFCPACGQATPTEVRQDTGAATTPEPTDTGEIEFRERLQRALGEAYELRELIGRGGFGVVYAAWDVNLKREVAVKALRFDLFPTEQLVGRFRREAESVAKLRHPNVVPIYAIGEAEGFSYFIMPRIEGSSLAEVFDAGTRLSMRDSHRIFRELVGALAAAHRKGIIHRDIKPENIFLEDPERRALLMDFGIAKTDETEDAKLTGTGMIVGTPHYMSPEQASGERHIDHRSDIYSLGVVAYQLFAGRTPFKETTSQKVIVERLTSTPEDLALINPAVPDEIAAAVMRCLERDPEERWNSTTNLLTVLDTVEMPSEAEAELSLAAQAAPLAAPTGRQWIGLGAAAAVSLGVWVATYGLHSPASVDRPAVSETEATQIGGDYLIAHGASGAFTSSVGFHQANAVSRQYLVAALGLDEARRRAQDDLALSNWHLVWRVPGRDGAWEARVASDGGISEYVSGIELDNVAARLTEEEARAVADSFLVAEGWDPTIVERRSARNEQQEGRVDHFFTWRDQSNAIPWTDDDGESHLMTTELRIDVRGDRVTRYSRSVSPPGAFSTPSMPTFVIAPMVLVIVASIIATLVLTFGPKRRRLVRWKPALIATGVCLTLLLVDALNTASNAFHESSTTTVGAFLLESSAQMAIAGLFLGFLVVVLGVSATTLARDVFPASTAAYEGILTGRWQPRVVAPAVLTGYLAGFVLVGVQGVIEAALSPLGAATDTGEIGYLGVADESLPFVSMLAESLAVGILAALAGLVVLSLGRHVFKSVTAAVTVPAALTLAFALPTAIAGDTGGPAFVIFLLLLLLTTVRFGVLAAAVAATVLFASEWWHLFASPNPTDVTSALVGSVLLLVPAGVMGVALARTKPLGAGN